MNLQFSLLHELFISTVPIAARVWTRKMLPLYHLLRVSVHLLTSVASFIPLNDEQNVREKFYARKRELDQNNLFFKDSEGEIVFLIIIIFLSVLKMMRSFSPSQFIRVRTISRALSCTRPLQSIFQENKHDSMDFESRLWGKI